MLALVWLFPVDFIAVFNTSPFIHVAYWLTESAGKYGTFFIVLLTSYCYTIRLKSRQEKLITFLKSLVSLTVFIALLAYLNEHVTKPLLKETRPSHAYLLQETYTTGAADSLLYLTKGERMAFFENLVSKNQAKLSNINTRVLQHWVEESGYSFPSGHSFNAFLLAAIMAFSLHHSRNPRLNSIYLLPLIWAMMVAVSRVALGAHTPLDVSAGSIMGITVAYLFLHFDKTRRLIIHRKYQ